MKLKRLSLFLALVMILSAFAGTFTFASAATAGGSFEIWRDGAKVSEYTGKITAAITDAAIEAGDTIKLTSDYHQSAREDLTVALTIDGQNQYKIYTTVADGTDRLFNTTANLTFQNVELETVQSCVQANTNAITLTFNNVHFSFSAAKASKAQIVLTISGQAANFKDCVARQTGASIFVWAALTANQTVVIDGMDYKSEGICMNSGNSAAFAQVSKTSTLTIKNSKIDASETSGQRLIYCDNGATPTITIENTAIFGSNGTYDVGQIGASCTAAEYIASGKLTLGDNVVFAGAGDNTSANGNIFRIRGTKDGANDDDVTTYAYNDATDPYNNIQVHNLDTDKYATVDALLAHFGVNKVAFNGSNYDEVAKSLGYVCRINGATAEASYANGKFTGYYRGIGSAYANGAASSIQFIGDACAALKMISLTGTSTFTFEGIADSTGAYPTLTGDVVRMNYSTNEVTYSGTIIFKNLTMKSSGTLAHQSNAGTTRFENVNLITNTTFGVFPQAKGNVEIVNSTITQTGTGCALRFHADGGKITIVNSTIQAVNGKPIDGAASGTLTIDENSVVVGAKGLAITAGKTVTVNGTAVTTSVTAGAMLDGASVRLARGNELAQSGIRFESTLTAAQIAAAEATGATVTYGTVVFKKADLGNKTVAELVAAANADANDALIVADIEAKDGIITDAEGNKTIRAAIINIKEKNYGVEFGAVAYIELTYADGATVRIYGAFDATNNVRSIKGVAELALADYEMEAGVVDGYNYYNEITVEIEGVETTVYSCYSDEQIAILNTYAGK